MGIELGEDGLTEWERFELSRRKREGRVNEKSTARALTPQDTVDAMLRDIGARNAYGNVGGVFDIRTHLAMLSANMLGYKAETIAEMVSSGRVAARKTLTNANVSGKVPKEDTWRVKLRQSTLGR